jgi:plastocyanin
MHLHLRKTWPALLLLLLPFSAAWAAAFTVTVGGAGLTFRPSTIDATVGDTVTFVNAGGFHNVVADNGSFRCAKGCDGVGNGNGTPSDDQWSSTITLGAAGDVPYHCEVHAASGMNGVIHVAAASGGGNENVPITAGFTGAWYDPTQGGHGIFLEVLPENRILAWWFTFAPDGTQAWFGNDGAIDGTTATIQVIQTQGGRWIPNFDPANVTQPAWGTLTFSFTDCNHGRVDFDSVMPGYGTGHMDLTRLTQPAGVTCP